MNSRILIIFHFNYSAIRRINFIDTLLKQQNYDVEIILLGNNNRELFKENLPLSQAINKSINLGNKYINNVLNQLNASLFIQKNHRKYKSIYLYHPSVQLLFPILLIANQKKLKKKLISDHVELNSTISYQNQTRFSKLLDSKLQKLAINNSKSCVFISEILQKYWGKRLNNNSTVLYPWVTSPPITFNTKNKNLNWLYLGTLAEKDDLLTMLKAYLLALKQNKDLSFYFLGNYAEKSQEIILDFANKHKLSGLILKQNYTLDELNLLVNNISIGLAIRKNTSFAHFGLAIKIFEYLKLGIKVVSTPTNSQLDEYLSLADFNSPESILHAISKDGVINHSRLNNLCMHQQNEIIKLFL